MQLEKSNSRIQAEVHALMSELDRRVKNTPDLKELQEFGDVHLIFVYCNLKKGHNNHDFYLGRSKFLGKAHTFEDKFDMMETPSFPIMFDNVTEGSKTARQVLGEAYAVTTAQLMRLDALMGNTEVFEREKRYIVLDDQQIAGKGTCRECWVYMNTVFERKELFYSNFVGLAGKHFWTWTKREPRH